MTPAIPGLDTARALGREVERTQLRARKGIRLVARRQPPQVGVTPKDEVWALGKARLWRYRSDQVRFGPPVMLFLGLIGDSTIFDIHPGNSIAERLLSEGFDVFLFDWGRPDIAEGDHSFETYLDHYFLHAVDAVCSVTQSEEVTLGAYCMGALLALLALGSRDDLPACRLVLFSPPCDHNHGPAMTRAFRERRITPAALIDDASGLVPADAVRAMFRLRQPTSDVVQYVTLWENLWRDEYVEAHRAVNHWAWNHRAIAGPAFCQMIDDYVQDNALVTGRARLGGRVVRLDRIAAPTLLVIAERDELVPPESSLPLLDMLGSTDTEVLRAPGGHAGALMGSVAKKVTIPGVVDWLKRHSGNMDA